MLIETVAKSVIFVAYLILTAKEGKAICEIIVVTRFHHHQQMAIRIVAMENGHRHCSFYGLGRKCHSPIRG